MKNVMYLFIRILYRYIVIGLGFLFGVYANANAATPSINEIAKLLASDGDRYDYFGYSVAIHEDTAVIGAYRVDDNGSDSGSAYVFTRSEGVWSEQAKLLASDGAWNHQFGFSVAVDGDTALIGAYQNKAAYVFTHSGGLWSEQAKLAPSDGASDYPGFGFSVAVDGDTALIGASSDDDNGHFSGSAYVFTRRGSEWSEQAKLLASDGATWEQFGHSTAIDGHTAVIGAFGDDDNGDYSGSAYVFTRRGSQWSEQAKLLASDGAASHSFGYSVAVDRHTALIGAIGTDENGYNSGSAYVFTRRGGEWSERAKLLASDGAFGDYFGKSVAVDGHTAVIGAPGVDNEAGSAYVFTRRGGEWSERAKLLASDGATYDGLGFSNSSVSVSGSTVIAGSHRHDGTDTDAGAAYIFSVCDGAITGGGWIDSPIGAYVADAGLVGKAKFNFQVKHKKGQSIPKGITKFKFKAGDLDFKSIDHDWLAVASAKGMFKGSGTINGAGNYGFMLSAIDAALTPSTDVDLFRIEIWDKDANGEVVYDNNLGADDGADPTTALGGGSIVIHSNKCKK